MRIVPFVLALFLATSAQAKDITITLNDEEQKNLIALLDLATKGGGVRAAEAVASMVKKLNEAAGGPKAVPTTDIPAPESKPEEAPKP